MEATDGGRKTTRFGNITYTTDNNTLPIDSSETYAVGDNTVVFY